MLFIDQFKIILWKNFKLFKKRTRAFIVGGEIIITIMIICTLAVRNTEVKTYEISKSIPPIENNYRFYSFLRVSPGDSLAFVFPKNQSIIDGKNFLNLFLNDTVIAPIVDKNTGQKYINIKEFDSEQQLEEFNNNDRSDKIIAALVFDKDYMNYSIRVKSNLIPSPKESPISNYGKFRQFEMLRINQYDNVFVPLQMATDRVLIKLKTGGHSNGYTAKIGELSKPSVFNIPSEEESRENSFDGFAPYIAFFFVGQMIHLSNRLMEEKESGTREGLISVGVHRMILWLTWMIIYLPISLIIIIFVLAFDISNTLATVNFLLFGISLFLCSYRL